jgi:hypothetical protein
LEGSLVFSKKKDQALQQDISTLSMLCGDVHVFFFLNSLTQLILINSVNLKTPIKIYNNNK